MKLTLFSEAIAACDIRGDREIGRSHGSKIRRIKMLCLGFPLVVVTLLELELTGKDSVTKTKMVEVKGLDYGTRRIPRVHDN